MHCLGFQALLGGAKQAGLEAVVSSLVGGSFCHLWSQFLPRLPLSVDRGGCSRWGEAEVNLQMIDTVNIKWKKSNQTSPSEIGIFKAVKSRFNQRAPNKNLRGCKEVSTLNIVSKTNVNTNVNDREKFWCKIWHQNKGVNWKLSICLFVKKSRVCWLFKKF